ncbi:MAG TPA: hypothetical protein DCS63_06275 [Elusimicrobia bacterium]|nr:hypothetical protein [Elusimicrobiota bacterium]
MRSILAGALLALAVHVAAADGPEPVFYPSRPSQAAIALFNAGTPSVKLTAGPAYNAGDRLFFTAVYALYYPPRGLARFPDGGRAAQAYAAAYLYEALPGGKPPRLAGKFGHCDMFLDARTSMLYRDGELLVRFSAVNPRHALEGGTRLKKAYYYAVSPASGKIRALEKAPAWPDKYPEADSGAHLQFFRPAAADLEGLGLPSPLPYIAGGGNDARLKRIVLGEEKSDRLLRLEILRHWLRTGRRALAEGTAQELKARLPGVPALKRYLAEEDIKAAETILAAAEQK